MLLVLFCLVLPQPSFAKDTKTVGKFAAVSGTVEMKKGGGKKNFKAFKNMAFTQGDTITTSAKSKATLHVGSDKEVTIAANTKLVVKQLVKSIKADSGKTQLSLVGGKVKVKVNKKLQGDSKLQVQTPNAIMGVMGTEFDVAYDGQNTYLGVTSGIVRVTLPSDPSGADGEESYDVYPNQFLHVADDGQVTLRPLDPAAQQLLGDEPDASQQPTDTLQQAANLQDEIRYGPPQNEDFDDDRDSSGGGSSSNPNTGGDTSGSDPNTGGDTSGSDPNTGGDTSGGDPNDPNTPTPETDYDRGYREGQELGLSTALLDAYQMGVDNGVFDSPNSTEYSERLEQGINEGANRAYDEDALGNYQADYDEGYATGYETALEDNSASGRPTQSEYERGFSEGYEAAYNEALSSAEATAKTAEGYNLGIVAEPLDGYNRGLEQGYEETRSNLVRERFEQGYNDGYDQGVADAANPTGP